MPQIGSIEKQIGKLAVQGIKQLAVLIDPDKLPTNSFIERAHAAGVDYFFLGGSLLTGGSLSAAIQQIRRHTDKPIVLFPGSAFQIDDGADGILLLSLLSGRNADFLIGQHVLAAPYLKKSQIEVLPTGYLLIDGGKPTTASYISNTQPIPAEKPEIAASTALAGELLGMRLIYLDAGSGALHPVPMATISAVKAQLSVPIIVGGGIQSSKQLENAYHAGASLVVIGNVLEEQPNLIEEFTAVAKLHYKEKAF